MSTSHRWFDFVLPPAFGLVLVGILWSRVRMRDRKSMFVRVMLLSVGLGYLALFLRDIMFALHVPSVWWSRVEFAITITLFGGLIWSMYVRNYRS